MHEKLPPDIEARIRRGHRSGDVDGEVEAAELSELLLERVADGAWSPAGLHRELDAAAECKWDGMFSDPILVHRAVMETSRWIRFAEASYRLDAAERIELRATGWIREGRALHMRGPGHARMAFVTLYRCLTFLEDVAGGESALRETLTRAQANLVAEQCVALLAVYVASLRRARFGPQLHAVYFRYGLRLVEAYVLGTQSKFGPTRYSKTDALSAQWLFAMCERGESGDRVLVDALYALNVETRPPDWRGLRTSPLRELEYARYHERYDEAERQRLAAIEMLDPKRMPRHWHVIKLMGYLKPGFGH